MRVLAIIIIIFNIIMYYYFYHYNYYYYVIVIFIIIIFYLLLILFNVTDRLILFNYYMKRKMFNIAWLSLSRGLSYILVCSARRVYNAFHKKNVRPKLCLYSFY